jgi:hypothetical protein
MKRDSIAAAMIFCTLTLLVTRPAQAAGSTSDPASDTSPDKKAFVRARNSAQTGTWTAAIEMLKSIDLAKVDDPDVVTHVDFSRKCAATADKLGISMKSNPSSIVDVVKGIDFVKLAAKLWKEGIINSAEIISQAKEVFEGMDMYERLDDKLCRRYDVN